MPAIHKTWVGSKQFFSAMHSELRETTDLNVQESGMHHADMVRNVVEGIQEVL